MGEIDMMTTLILRSTPLFNYVISKFDKTAACQDSRHAACLQCAAQQIAVARYASEISGAVFSMASPIHYCNPKIAHRPFFGWRPIPKNASTCVALVHRLQPAETDC